MGSQGGDDCGQGGGPAIFLDQEAFDELTDQALDRLTPCRRGRLEAIAGALGHPDGKEGRRWR